MPVTVDIPFSKSWSSPRPRGMVFGYLTDFEKTLPADFPGIERFEPLSPLVYRWTFEKLEYGGHSLAFKMVTRFEVKPGEAVIAVPVPEPGASLLSASWRLSDAASGTAVAFQADIQVELPIPGFLKGMATPLAKKEIGKLLERYASRAEKNLAT